ncbi:MAG: putative Ig domain-containing protein [Planctomycetota bacterium]
MVDLGRKRKIHKTLRGEDLETRWLLASDWQNPVNPVDVDGLDGGAATPVDALHILTELSQPTVRDPETFRLPDLGPEEGSPPPFFDVDGDQFVSPLDALLVIQALEDGNDNGGGGPRAPDSVVAGSRAAAEEQVTHDTLVNTTTARVQSHADVAGFTDGSFVTVWNSAGQDGSSTGVYAQRYDSLGSKTGGEFRVNSETRRSQQYAAVDTNSSDQFAVVWQSLAQDGSGWGVYGQMFDSDGAPLGEEFRVNETTRGSQHSPDVAYLDDGSLVVTWEGRGETDNNGIFMRRFDSAGTPTSGEQRVNEFSSGAQNRPAIADAGETIYIAWDGKGAASNRGIYLATINDDTREMQIGTNTSGTQRAASLATGADGRVVVGWQERPENQGGWGTRAQIYDANLEAMGVEMHANQTTRGLQAGTSAAVLDDGSVVLGWYGRGEGDNLGIFTRSFDDSGSPLTGEQLTNITTRARQSRPAVAASGNGYVMAWDGYGDADSRGVYARFVLGDPSNNPPMLVEPIPDQTALASESFTFDITAFFADPDVGDVLTYGVLETLPSWLDFNETTGTFSGTPQASDIGGTNLTVQAIDTSGASVDDTFQLSVVDDSSEFMLGGTLFADTNGNGVADSGESGLAGVTVSLESDGMTIATTMTSSDGSYGFTSVGGNYTIVVDPPASSMQTADPDGSFDDQTTVALSADTTGLDFGYNRTPLATTIPDGMAQSDVAFSYVISSFFSDPDGGELSFASLNSLPAWLSLSSSGTFTGTPSLGDVGTTAVMVTATDEGGLTVTQSVNIVVSETSSNQPPEFNGPIPTQMAMAGSPYGFDVTSFFSDPDGDPLSYTASLTGGGELPAWLMFNMSTGQFSGTPQAADVGTSEIRVTANDGQATVDGDFTLTVNPEESNEPPTLISPIADQTVDVSQNQMLDLDISANFSDPDGDPLSYTAMLSGGGSLPDWVMFNEMTGQFSGTPTAADVGVIDVQVSASDGQLSASDEFSITVFDNQPPQVVAPVPDQIVSADQTTTLDVSGVFSDPGDTLTLTTGPLPAWITFAEDEFTIEPLAQHIGEMVEAMLTATDSANQMATDTFMVSVVANQPPIAMDIPDQEALVDMNFYLPTGDFFTDPDGSQDALTYAVTLSDGTAVPDWLQLSPTGVLSGTPPLEEVGTLELVATATDAFNASASTSPFELVVTATGTAVEVTLATLDGDGNVINSVGAGETFTLVGYVQDVRTAPTGVFSAYMDVNYPEGLITPSGSIEHDSTYSAGTSGSTATPGLIDEVGGVDGISQLGGDLEEVFRLQMTAGTTPGTAIFTTDMADDPIQHVLTVFTETGATPPQYVSYLSWTLEIVSNAAQSPGAFALPAVSSADQAVVPPVEAASPRPVDQVLLQWQPRRDDYRRESAAPSPSVVDSVFDQTDHLLGGDFLP